MKDNELANLAVVWLLKQAADREDRPVRFEPKYITDHTGGLPSRLGIVSKAVCNAIKTNGVRINYERIGNKRYFVLL